VDLFFEISGFLIVTLLLRERDAHGGISLRRFYARRALRIFPLYYGLLAGFAFLYFVARPDGAGAAAFRHDLPALAMYLTNWIGASGMLAITWSLSAEEQFYVVWPAVEKWLSRHVEVVIVAAIALSQVIQFGLIDPFLQRWLGWGPKEPVMLRETTFTPIFLGVLLAHLLHDPGRYERIARWLGARFSAPLWLAALVVLCGLLPSDIRGWGRLAVHAVQFFLLASCVVREDNGLGKFLRWRPVARIGTVSYGIYLLHHIALGITEKGLKLAHFNEPLLLFLIGLGVVVVMAEMSYRFYETPFLKLRTAFGRAKTDP
jgi:peptidoglycan/LPS O-acetylase OafA/YrhL